MGGVQAVAASRAADDEAAALEEARRQYGENVGAAFVMPVFNPLTGRYEVPNQVQPAPGG